MSITILLTHPGTQYSHQLAKQLSRYGYLSEFWTGFALDRNKWYSHMILSYLPPSWHTKIANRVIDGIPGKQLHTMPFVEWQALQKIKHGEPVEEVFHKRNQQFQEKIPTAAIQKADAVIGFDTSSWLLAERARQMGKVFFLDQSISHPLVRDDVLSKVAKRYPEWREDVTPRSADIFACEQQEYELATKIVVPSAYTKQTLVSQGVQEEKIVINPFGVDLNLFCPVAESKSKIRPLRFLFLGSVTARKGVPLLLEAWHSLAPGDSELWLVGPIRPHIRSLIPDLPGLRVLGKYPHAQLPSLIQQCDVLVFPSYNEGFALVLLEALACGLPVITTDASGIPNRFKNGAEGFIVPTGNLEALCDAMNAFIQYPDRIREMSQAARRFAEDYSWDTYGERWSKIIQDTL